MNQPDIAPLAKRLAEENNVDWHALEGTGEDGRIVERDVLEYLARVMAGEEDLDPTPEPVPEGMEAWPEEQGSAPGGARAPEAPAAGGANGAPSDAGAGLLLDDGDAGGEDGLLISDEPGRSDVAASAGTPAEPAGETARPDEPARRELQADPAAGAAREGGDAGGPLPDLFSETRQEREPSGEDELFDGELTWDEPTSAAARGPEQEVDAREDAFDFDGLPGHREPEYAPRVEDEPAALGGAPDPAQGRVADDEAVPTAAMDLGGAAAPAAREMAEAEVPDVASAPAAVARYRQILRRHVDLGAASAAQRTLASELGRDEALPIDALLALAALKAAAELELSGEVALARVEGDAVVLRLVEAGDARSVLRAVRDASGSPEAEPGRVGLAVADLSSFGIDEAALDLDAPLLSLGRILTDSATGSPRGSVSLAGDLPVGRAASVLARVAELVEDPLRLLV